MRRKAFSLETTPKAFVGCDLFLVLQGCHQVNIKKSTLSKYNYIWSSFFFHKNSLSAFLLLPPVSIEKMPSYIQKRTFVAEMAILAKKNLRKKCVNRDKM